MDTITLILTGAEAELFKEFQRHHELFTLLRERKVFDQKSSAVTLHFDEQGTLQTIQRADFLYSRRHELSTVDVTTQSK